MKKIDCIPLFDQYFITPVLQYSSTLFSFIIMSIYVHIIGGSSITIWGLTSRERKLRVLRNTGVTNIVDDIATVPENSSILLLKGDYLFDDRVINYLVQTPNVLLKIPQGPTEILVAAHVVAGQALEAREAVAKNLTSPSMAGVKIETAVRTADYI